MGIYKVHTFFLASFLLLIFNVHWKESTQRHVLKWSAYYSSVKQGDGFIHGQGLP